MKGRPGLVVFLGGVSCFLASTALGFFLAQKAQVRYFHAGGGSPPDHLAGLRIGEDHDILANVNALMWMAFGLGAGLTMAGLRMMTRPVLEGPPPTPLGPVREVSENPEWPRSSGPRVV